MGTPLAQHFGNTPQSESLPGQIANSAGGFSFAVDDWTRLNRFLVLGSEGGSYYASERKLTIENAAAVERCLKLDGRRVVARIVEISDAGRAPKNDPALLALALAAKRGDADTRSAAFAALPKVARIGTHLFHFAEYVKALGGGWGRGTTNAFARWYAEMDLGKLVLQAIKYQQRDGWSHRDILRKSHPKIGDPTRNSVLNWMVKGWPNIGPEAHPDPVLARIWAFERAKALTSDADLAEICRLITEYDLPHECVPNEMKKHAAVWESLLPHMGVTALVRNLAKMTAVGLLAPLSAGSRVVCDMLGDFDHLRAARIHPLSLLVALKTYAQGKGDKGSLEWTPVQPIVDALDGAFYSAFKTVEPTGKNHMLAIDISGSMTWVNIAGMGLTPRDGAGAMALVTANVEPNYHIMAFSNGVTEVPISARTKLDAAIQAINGLHAGGTDCSLPMLYATQNKIPVDVFCVYTDSETYAGNIHPHKALEQYRQKMGRPAKLVVIGMVASEFTIANPGDAGMLDVVGFDTSTPAIIADFAGQ